MAEYRKGFPRWVRTALWVSALLATILCFPWPVPDYVASPQPSTAPSEEPLTPAFQLAGSGGIFCEHPTRFWALVPGRRASFVGRDVSINAQGFRGPELSKKARNEYRVLMLGDSCTFGHGVGESETIAAYLQRDLQERMPSRKVVVINAGVPGYSSYQGKLYAQELAARPGLGVDFVLAAYSWNDRGREHHSDAERLQAQSRPVTETRSFLWNFRFYRFLRWVVLSSSGAGREEPPVQTMAQSDTCRVAPVDTGSNFAAIVESFVDIPCCAVVLPTREPLPFDDPFVSCLAASTVPLRQAEFVDLNKSWSDKMGASALPRYFLDEVHLNPEGCERVARDLWPHIHSRLP